jgi:5-methylcytosine-specific restriction endonuclease McrA
VLLRDPTIRDIECLQAVRARSKEHSMRTLVLNAGYEPLAVVSFKRALVLVLEGKASPLAIDDDHPVLSAAGEWDRPSVILLRRYVRVPTGRAVPVSRRGVLRRDQQRCAYCAASASTIDHVMPRSRGGADSWENLVACCLRCNNVKGDRTPQEMMWELRLVPAPPHGSSWTVRGVDKSDPRWEPYLALAA